MSPQETWLTIPVQTVTADSAHSHICTSCWVSFFSLLLLFKHTQAASTSSTLQVLIVSVCFCVYTVCHYLVMKKLQLWPPRVTVLEMRPFSPILFLIHANTHWVRTVCRFATNSSPFLKLFFWVVKLGLQLNVGWLSRHKLKRMNDYSYDVFKIITGVFIKGFWMQLNFISVISTHKFFPLSLNFLSHSWRTGMLFSDHL